MRYQRFSILACLLCVVAIQGCRERTVGAAAVAPGSVLFRIEEAASKPKEDNPKAWLATYDAGGKKARFRIELTMKPPSGQFGIAFTSGAFSREPTSDSSVLLRDLARALEATKPPVAGARKDRLPFNAAVLGRDQSRSDENGQIAGSFVPQPKGTWITTKVFVADGEGEFFLNLNPAGGQGEISIKDPEYGDVVMKELAAVL